jgi:hypothetical protein
VAPRPRGRPAPAHGPLAADRVQGAARRHAAEDRRRCRSSTLGPCRSPRLSGTPSRRRQQYVGTAIDVPPASRLDEPEQRWTRTPAEAALLLDKRASPLAPGSRLLRTSCRRPAPRDRRPSRYCISEKATVPPALSSSMQGALRRGPVAGRSASYSSRAGTRSTARLASARRGMVGAAVLPPATSSGRDARASTESGAFLWQGKKLCCRSATPSIPLHLPSRRVVSGS